VYQHWYPDPNSLPDNLRLLQLQVHCRPLDQRFIRRLAADYQLIVLLHALHIESTSFVIEPFKLGNSFLMQVAQHPKSFISQRFRCSTPEFAASHFVSSFRIAFMRRQVAGRSVAMREYKSVAEWRLLFHRQANLIENFPAPSHKRNVTQVAHGEVNRSR
jgi:hypothetical protein